MTPPLTTDRYDRRRHDVAGFSSGQPKLDDWLKRYASQGEDQLERDESIGWEL